MSVTCVVSNLVLCSLAGYAFARLRFPGNKILFIAILATLMVPFQVVMIPTLLIVKHLGLVNTLPALIVPNLVTPFGIYLLRQFFLTLPVELEEAAMIDGGEPVPDPAQHPASADGPTAEHGRGPDVPLGLERLPVAAGGDVIAEHDDDPARSRHLPERALHELAGAHGRHIDEPATRHAAFPCRTTFLRQLYREYGDQMTPATTLAALVTAALTVAGTTAAAGATADRTAAPDASTKVLVVSTTGNDGNAGTVAAPLRTIQVAVGRLPHGGTIELRGGAYHQRVRLAGVHGITLRPYQHEAAVLDGSGLTPPNGISAMVNISGSSDITISGLP